MASAQDKASAIANAHASASALLPVSGNGGSLRAEILASFSWSGANVFLGARGLVLPLGSGKDSQQKLSYRACKTGPFLDSLLHNRRFSSALGGAQAAPTMRHGGTERSVSRVFTTC